MSAWTRLLCRILDSSLWEESDPTRIVWVTLLAMADRDGHVWAPDVGIARRAREPLEITQVALLKFQAPDPLTTTPDNEGRRIEKIEGGYVLLNYTKIRMQAQKTFRREYLADKQAEHRQKVKGEAQQSLLPAELPQGFPTTEEEAKAFTAAVGCSPEFAVTVWHQAAGRGGKDSKGNLITKFHNYLSASWAHERERISGKKGARTNPDSKEMQEKIPTRILKPPHK